MIPDDTNVGFGPTNKAVLDPLTPMFSTTILFPILGNMMVLENTLLRKALSGLSSRLPPGWATTMMEDPTKFRIRAADGRTAEISAEVRLHLDPREAMVLAATRATQVVVSPWMSSATQRILQNASVNWMDLTGNVRLVLAEPGLFVETVGATQNPWPEARVATLKGAKAAHLVRALCENKPPIGVRALAGAVKMSPGYVSKLLTMLDQEGSLTRNAEGRVEGVDLGRLLQQWANDAPLSARSSGSTWLDPRGLSAFLGRLQTAGLRYALTSSLAAARKAPISSPRLASLYVDDPDGFAEALGLRPAEAGANVLLLAPEDDGVFENRWNEEGLWYAALPQVAADLLSGTGRGPAEGEALIAWMTAHPEVWRG
jgi:hypothetical protein